MREIFQIVLPSYWRYDIELDFTYLTLTKVQQGIIFLGLVIVLDFVTGIAASWIEFKKGDKTPGQKQYVIESAKLRLTVVKFIFYSIGILSARAIEVIFLLRKIPSSQISIEDLTLTAIITGFFSIIEIYSILFENIKRMGFDIIQKTKIIAIASWKLYNTLKNGSNIN